MTKLLISKLSESQPEKKTLKFTITPKDMSFLNEDLKPEAGEFVITAAKNAIQKSNTNLLTGNSEKWSTPDMYWNMTLSYINQYKTARANKTLGISSKVNGIDEKKEFKIFPNPAINGILTIYNEVTDNPYSVTITNLEGKLVYRKESSLKVLTINTSLKPGLYFLNVSSENKTQVKKLIIK